MSLTETLPDRIEYVLGEIDAGRMTHNVQIELVAIVRSLHACAKRTQHPVVQDSLVIVAPAKTEQNVEGP